MCGLVGVVGEIYKKEEEVFKNLLILDMVRGTDSTGVAFISTTKNTVIAKEVGGATELFESPRFTRGIRQVNRILMGHNRWATQGGINRNTAHPFETERFIGMHNGTLRSRMGLDPALHCAVDSQHIIENMNEHGDMETVAVLDGAYALVWYDQKEGSLNFARNRERPLFFAKALSGRQVYWASEEWMLEVALSRAEVKFHDIAELPTETRVKMRVGFNGPLGEIETTLRTYEGKKYSNITSFPSSKNLPFTGDKKEGPQEKKEEKVPFAEELLRSFLDKTEEAYVGTEDWDEFGAKYYNIYLDGNEEIPCRLYHNNRQELSSLTGEVILGKISKLERDRKGMHLRVSPTGVMIVEVSKEDDSIPYATVNGKDMTKSEFEKLTCCWCTSSLEKGKYKETYCNELLCNDCCSDPDITQYVRVK